MPEPTAPPDQAARDRIAARPRHHPVRGGRRRVGQDHRAGRPRPRPGDERDGRAAPHRRHHLHREGGSRAARPDPTGTRERARRRPTTPRSGDRCRPRSTSSTAPPSAPCTPSPSACCPSTRSKPACPPGRGARRGELRRGLRARWSVFRDQLLADPLLERTLLLLLAAGVRARRPARRWPTPSTTTGTWSRNGSPTTAPDPAVHARGLDERSRLVDAICAEPAMPGLRPTSCAPGWTRSPTASADSRAIADERRPARGPRPRRRRPKRPASGRQRRRQSVAGTSTSTDLRGRGPNGRRGARRRPRPRSPSACAERLGRAIRRFTLRRRRRAAGRRAARVPRPAGAGPRPAARPRARTDGAGRVCTHRYQRLLLDEFQDTDPIQIELAVRIAAADPPTPAAGQRPVGSTCGQPRPPVRGRRPEAVDLPVPPGRHLDLPASRATASAPKAAGWSS